MLPFKEIRQKTQAMDHPAKEQKPKLFTHGVLYETNLILSANSSMIYNGFAFKFMERNPKPECMPPLSSHPFYIGKITGTKGEDFFDRFRVKAPIKLIPFPCF